jgi:hypothetical protein
MTIKNHIKFLVLIALSSLLLSCATTQKSFLNTLENESILVISGYPDTYYVNVIGTTAFTNHNKEFENLDLSINEIIQDDFKTNIRNKNYISYDDNETFDFTKGYWYSKSRFKFKDSIEKFKEINSHYKSRYILLIGTEDFGDSVFFTNQLFRGYGITRRYLYGQPKTVLYATMKMDLIDTTTYKIIKSVSLLQHEDNNRLKQKKLHELEKGEFLIFKENYRPLFNQAINELLSKL